MIVRNMAALFKKRHLGRFAVGRRVPSFFFFVRCLGCVSDSNMVCLVICCNNTC